MDLTFVPLAEARDRSAFRSGSAPLDDWFQKRAGQDEKRDVARVFVAVDADGVIAGFYSLGAYALAIDDLPLETQRKLPRYDLIPAALIGRLARDKRYRGKGVGDLLVADAIRRIVSADQTLAVHAILVDAKDEEAAGFYASFGFVRFPSRPSRLFLMTATARHAFGPSG